MLLLDEPSAGLAPRLVSELLSRMRLLVDRGLPVLLVEQNVRAALEVVDQLYLLERGRIVGKGPADVDGGRPAHRRSLSGHDRRRSGRMNIAQQIINGLVLGSGYACIALGWTMLLGVARLVNFAHGQLYMLGAFVAWYAMHQARAVLSVRHARRGHRARAARRADAGRDDAAGDDAEPDQPDDRHPRLRLRPAGRQRADLRRRSADLPGTLSRAKIDIGALWFTWQDVLRAGRNLAAVRRGVAGLPSARGSARWSARWPRTRSSRELFGINARLVYLLVFVFECAAVALGAALVAPRIPILTSMGFDEVIMTFVVVVLGGIGSIGGALLAGLGLGLFTAFFGALVSPAYTTAAAFALLLALLVVRPAGLAAK